MDCYAIAPNGIYWSIQGEGHLRGQQMAFLRLSGCSIKCPGCDTNYTLDRLLSPQEIVEELNSIVPAACRDRWIWVTGGEPMDRDLRPLMKELKNSSGNYSIAIATSGAYRAIEPVDWLSVRPHGGELKQRCGSEIKLVHGLNGMDLDQWLDANPADGLDFFFKYVQPISIAGKEDPASLAICLDFLRRHPDWSLSRQDHLKWGME